jgi:2,5-furandicarboxylate decarboxylase 1
LKKDNTMVMGFRDAIAAQRAAGQLVEIDRPVDIRYLGTLIEESDTALQFNNVAGYDIPVVSGVMNNRDRMGMAYGCAFNEIQAKLREGVARPIPPKLVNSGPAREVCYQKGSDVDLFSLPVPLFAELDGGPMITAGVTIASDGDGGLNAGVYRYLIRERNLTGIDLVTPNDLRRIAEANTMAGKPTPISISIGTHPAITLASTYRPPVGVDEIAIAGGVLGEGVQLTPCETIDVPCVADAEIVLEAEILPTGWTKPEGRFGEFTRIMGALHWNPHVRIKAIYTRKNPIFWALHMPWEVSWLSAVIQEASLRQSLHEANINVSAINITPGGTCFFHAVIAINGRVGDGKQTLHAAFSADDFKQVIVVDDDIDVFDPLEVEWAVATRVQADTDVVIASGMRTKPLDPSLTLVTGRMPTTGKMGIDATMSPDIPRSRFQRISYAFADDVDTETYLGDDEGAVDQPENVDINSLAADIRAVVAEAPVYYSELVQRFWAKGFQNVSQALGRLHETGDLWQDEDGRICLVGSPFAAVPPSSKITNRSE